MNYARPVKSLKRKAISHGFSLIELLVALTIGLVIVGAALSAYLGSAQTGKFSASESRMNEDAQAALDFIAQQLRMAGSNPKRPTYPESAPSNPLTQTMALIGCEDTFTNIGAATAISALTCTTPSSSKPHSIAIAYEADTLNTTPSSTGVPTDCVNTALAAATASITMPDLSTKSVTFYEAFNRFYISTPTSGKPSLYCKGNGTSSTAQALVENIEDLKFQYGTAPASGGDGTVAGYITADNLTKDATVVNLGTGALRWGRVTAVRVCVIVRSDSLIAMDEAAAPYLDCDGSSVTPSDKYLRRAYFTTVSLRNRILTP
jgi:type IV pilus assembly protein PilW